MFNNRIPYFKSAFWGKFNGMFNFLNDRFGNETL